MTALELIKLLSALPPHTQVLVEAEDETLNVPTFEPHIADDSPGNPFVVLGLPETYDTYCGPKTKGA